MRIIKIEHVAGLVWNWKWVCIQWCKWFLPDWHHEHRRASHRYCCTTCWCILPSPVQQVLVAGALGSILATPAILRLVCPRSNPDAPCHFWGLGTVTAVEGVAVTSVHPEAERIERECDTSKHIAALVQGASLKLWYEWFNNEVA